MKTAAQCVQQKSDKANRRIIDTKLRSWLDAEVFACVDVSLSRSEIAALTESPCTRAASNLDAAMRQYLIHTLAQLNRIGCDALLRIPGIGVRAGYVAACILESHGYDVEQWLNRKDSGQSWTTRLRLVHSKTRKQKHG